MCPLTQNEILTLVEDTLQGLNDAKRLAAFLHQRTDGNPLFVKQLVLFMHEAGLLSQRADQTWVVAADATLEKELPGTIVDLYEKRLKSWPPEFQKTISRAACLGNGFDLDTLAIVTSAPIEECRTLLQTAVKSHMVEPARSKGPGGEKSNQVYAFLHDRIQQAAHNLIDKQSLPSIRLKMGRLLLNRLSPEQLDQQIFAVAAHFNAGRQDITSREETIRAIELNLLAARKSRSATDYQAMLEFHRAASAFFEETKVTDWLWTHRHDLILQLFKERSESEFLEGDKSEAERCLRIAVERANTALEKAQVLNQVIVHHTLLGRYPEAIDAARQALALFDISLPENDFEVARDAEIAAVRQQLAHRSVETLRELPVMSDADMCMATKILITMGPPCYRSHQKLWSVLVPKVVNLTLRYGHIPQLGYSHTAFAGLLGWVDNDYKTAKAFGELASDLMDQHFPSPTDQSVFYLMIGSSCRHWFKHLKVASEDYAEAYEIGVRSGNLQYAAYAFGHNMYCRYYQGVPLRVLSQETRRALDFSRTRLNQWGIDLFQGGGAPVWLVDG
jgi:predicted ATPase